MVKMRALAVLTFAAAALVVPASALADPPANDAFAQAIALAGDSDEVFATNAEATKEPGEPNHGGNTGGASVWYRWTAGRAGRVVTSSCDSDFDTALAVYTGSAVSALTPVASSSDCDAHSTVEFTVTPGVEYHIAVDGIDGATGEFYLYFFQRPANDDRENARTIGGDAGSVEVSNRFASVEPGEAAHGGPGGASVWFRWTAPSSGPVRFTTCGMEYDTLLGVYAGTAATPFATDDDYCGGGSGSAVAFVADAGIEYFIAVDGYLGDWVEGPLQWDRSILAPRNFVRPTITGVPQEGSTLAAGEGVWNGTPPFSFSYAWARCDSTATSCQTILGATGATYTLTFPDVSFRIRVFITATNSAGSSETNSAATAPVAPRPHAAPRNTAPPSISGAAVENGVLTSSAGSWDGYPPPSFSFQWESCSASGDSCIEIPGEVDVTLTLSRTEVGRRIRLIVIARNAAGAAAAPSSLTPVVSGLGRRAPRRCVVPSVTGKTLRVARAQILRNRCRVGSVQRRFSSRVRAGRIVGQSPRAGRR
ncbi:MAG: PASTA domain-containing protein, partial [Actinomycetota bacterium]|nr:PASTA domain-containing protein [Actinomycetota bacterium]